MSLSWHRAAYSILRVLVGPFLNHKLNYSCEKVRPKSNPYIVLANHNTDYDPFLVGLAFPDQIYYVASEHIFRWGLISSLIKFIVAPIPRLKATTEIHTVMEILRKLRAGANVCLFAEGNRSFSGETGQIHPSTGKLIKKSGVSLITFRLHGGYFTSPRWSKGLRRGKMTGRMVREYTPDELKKMTSEEITKAIERDLYVNAYEEQKEECIPYTGKNLAHNLETALYRCPECNKIDSLKSEGDRFYCSCGLDLTYNEYGFFTSNTEKEPVFMTVLDWVRWQEAVLAKEIEGIKSLSPDNVIYSDKDQTLWNAAKEKNILVGKGTLLLYNDRLVFDSGEEKYTFGINDLSSLEIIGQRVIAFATNDRQAYEIKSDWPRSALKYRDIFNYLKTK
ncbi:MAG: lysophospholipid acyltransferase family protein [Acetivibrionales bacterium]|jgi:1-acyl-sn-glycerol-3-phosphate acyltransferase